MDADEEGADAVVRESLLGYPAADDELLAVGVLDLDPGGGAPAGLIGGVEALGDNSLEPLLGAGGEDGGSIFEEVLGGLPALTG